MYPGLLLLVYLTWIPIMAPTSSADITITDGDKPAYWKGCIFQKIPLFTSATDFSRPCEKCAITRNPKLVVKRKGFPQRMYNCTEACERVTICTHARYYNGKDNRTYPLCYQCQSKKEERIHFSKIMLEEICLDECRNCSFSADLPRAYECSHLCHGLPTFCYPKVILHTHRLCYQAKFWYGCDSELVGNKTEGELSPKCKICASLAKNHTEGQECAGECHGLPTYSLTQADGAKKFYSCKIKPKVTHADLFMYEIPRVLLRHFHISNPVNLYMKEMVTQPNLLSGFLTRFIFAPLNMTLLTYPRPRGFELDTSN